jgi:UDP-N-acetylglucosamine--N-acetylmuramyl-(pentapeptide) pyrophosphoryl-undecaprenol N-acetylglucosamine transferase
MTDTSPRVVLAGGGSAGHTSPLIAVAEQIHHIDPAAAVSAIGTARGLETRTVPEAGLPLRLIPPVPMPRRPGADLAKLPVRLTRAVAAAGTILRQAHADVLLGFGGYVATPAYLAATRLRVPIIIHEQNALPGLANRLAARLTRNVVTSFPDTPLPHARWIGLPLRSAIVELANADADERAGRRKRARTAFGLDPDTATLLVTGGSQGAVRLNEAVRQARDGLLGNDIQILHLTGDKNASDGDRRISHPQTGASYVPVPFLAAMEQAYAAADLVLCRSGASSVLEAAVLGLPALLVPYAVGNGEQARNAAGVVRAGGAELLDDATLTGQILLDRVPALVDDPDRLATMGRAARTVADADAAAQLAQLAIDVAAGRTPAFQEG